MQKDNHLDYQKNVVYRRADTHVQVKRDNSWVEVAGSPFPTKKLAKKVLRAIKRTRRGQLAEQKETYLYWR